MPHDPRSTAEAPEHPRGGRLNAEISNRVVHLMAQYTGRGPTKARAIVHDDIVVCLLRDTLTKGERTLVGHGEGETVLASRKAQQRVLREDAVTAVEELTGREVAAFMSDNHIGPDVAVEVFVLAPVFEDAPAPASAGGATPAGRS